MEINPDTLAGIKSHMLLFFTGLSRSASEVAGQQIKNTPHKERELHAMRAMVDIGKNTLEKGDIEGFGRLLHEAWQLKRELSHLIANPQIDEIYAAALAAGAYGGKLLGAGAGGFMLIYADPSRHAKIKEKLGALLCVPFNFDTEGTQIIYEGANQFEKSWK